MDFVRAGMRDDHVAAALAAMRGHRARSLRWAAAAVVLAVLPTASPMPNPAPPSMTDDEMVKALNERFRAGHPSNNPAEAGVFVSQFDIIRDPIRPWLPCSADSACAANGLADRLSGTVINHRLPRLFSKSLGGVVLSPSAVRLHCACESLDIVR